MLSFFDWLSKTTRQSFPDLVGYSRSVFGRDLAAGLTVGIVALPLSLALAIATGVPPILGLYTAGIAGFLAAVFSGSPYSVSGPAAAMVPILAAVIKEHGLQELPYITILAALFLLFFAIMGIGKYIRKVPESVVLGFTAGVAIVILVSQINSFLGLSGLGQHLHFGDKLADTITHLGTVDIWTVLIGICALAIILRGHHIPYIGKLPTTLIAVVFVTLLTLWVPIFSNVATLGSTYGALQLGFPGFALGDFSLSSLGDRSLWFPAFEIAALIAVESLLCAVVADKLTKSRHRSSQELMAQGIANLGSAAFGGIPATAVIARTGTMIKSGGVTRIASIIHALVVLAFVVALAPLAAKIPLAALSAVLMVTAVKIAEVKTIRAFVRAKHWQLSAVLATTLTLTVFTDLVIGVSAGLLLHITFAAHGKLRGTRGQDGPLILNEEEIV